MAEYTPEPRAYELMVLLTPDMGEEALESEIERISNQLTGSGAEINSVKSTTPWGRRRLAYPIQKHQDAFYVLYSVSSQPGQLDPFERDLKLNNSVLRYLLIREEEAGDEEEPEEAADLEEGAGDVEVTESDESEAEAGSAEPAEDTEDEVSEEAEDADVADDEAEEAPADEADDEEQA